MTRLGESHPGEWPPPPPEQIPDDAAEIEASGLFEEIQVRRYVWEKHYAAEEYIALLNTFSGHIAMEAAKRDHLYREIRTRIGHRPNPRVRRHWCAILRVARRKEQAPAVPWGVLARSGELPFAPHPRITEAPAPSWTERQQRLEAALCSGRARAACS
jgi:hypothetical protein